MLKLSNLMMKSKGKKAQEFENCDIIPIYEQKIMDFTKSLCIVFTFSFYSKIYISSNYCYNIITH